MKTALIISTFNRPAYLRQCLESVSRASKPDVLILVDDASTDKETIALVRSFTLDITTHIVLKSANKGIKDSLKIGFDLAFNHYGCDVAISLDGDCIVKPHFIPTLLSFKEKYPGHIISGINTTNYNKDGTLRNPIVKEFKDHVHKKYMNGQTICINRADYDNYVSKGLQSKGNWDYQTSLLLDKPVITPVPSLSQHIGAQSSMGHAIHEAPDVSLDFKLLHLPDVTLFGVDSYDPKGLLKSADISTRDIEFGAVKMLTEKLFSGREAYSNFCINEMHKYIDTTHVLIIHPDSCVLNPFAWDDSWLEWDYIGALWEWKGSHKNGNGGFSLRSQKFIKAIAKLGIAKCHPEDEVICNAYRDKLEKMGMKFAPDDVCRKFSIEAFGNPNPKYNGQFGYHGGNIDFTSLPKESRPYERVSFTTKRSYPAIENYKNRAIGRHQRRY